MASLSLAVTLHRNTIQKRLPSGYDPTGENRFRMSITNAEPVGGDHAPACRSERKRRPLIAFKKSFVPGRQHRSLSADRQFRRRSEALDRQVKYVADAAHGSDDTLTARVSFQLSAQPRNSDVDAAIESILVPADRMHQVQPGEWLLRHFDECQQQRKFTLAQLDQLPVRTRQLPSVAVEIPAAKSAVGLLGLRHRQNVRRLLPSQYRANPRHEFSKSDGFRNTIICA